MYKKIILIDSEEIQILYVLVVRTLTHLQIPAALTSSHDDTVHEHKVFPQLQTIYCPLIYNNQGIQL